QHQSCGCHHHSELYSERPCPCHRHDEDHHQRPSADPEPGSPEPVATARQVWVEPNKQSSPRDRADEKVHDPGDCTRSSEHGGQHSHHVELRHDAHHVFHHHERGECDRAGKSADHALEIICAGHDLLHSCSSI